MSLYLTWDATWRRNRRYVTSGFINKITKTRITRKRNLIDQKLTLITNRKSAIAVQNLSFNLTCDATWRRNRCYVTSGLTKKRAKIAHNFETVHDRANIAINHLSEVGNCLSEYVIIFELWRHLAEKSSLRHFRLYKKRGKIAYNVETVHDRANIAIHHL